MSRGNRHQDGDFFEAAPRDNFHEPRRSRQMEELRNRPGARRNADAQETMALQDEEWGITGYRAWRNAMEASKPFPESPAQPTWEELFEDRQHDWQTVCHAAVYRAIVEADGLSWQKLGALIYHTLAQMGIDRSGGAQAFPRFEDLPVRWQLCYQACGRHLACMAEVLDGEDANATEHEEHWSKWIVQQLQKAQSPVTPGGVLTR